MSQHNSISGYNTATDHSPANQGTAASAYLEYAAMPTIQHKLSIGAVNDPMETEADAMADTVMRMPQENFIQRQCANCEEEEKVQRKPVASFIQRKESTAGTVASDAVSNQITASKGSGNTMDSHTRSFMQSRFGTDFSAVKIHTGGEAIQMNRELNAKAFTVGNDIYFNDGQYNPNSNNGKHLLAHELTHTVQQGSVQGLSLVQRTPEDETEAIALAALPADDVKKLIVANNKSALSTELLLCLIWKESGFNPNAKSSTSTATGLMQMTKPAVDQVNQSTPKGVHFEHSEMTNASRNIECGTYYLKIRIDWANGNIKKGLEGFGTGPGYADNILVCETCISTTPANRDTCLGAIHH